MNLNVSALSQKDSQLIKILNDEISEIKKIKTSNNIEAGNKLLRLSENYFQIGELYKKSENQKYLSIPTEKRSAYRKKIFVNSDKYLNIAYKYASQMVSKFKNHPRKPDALYIISYYLKERGEYKKSIGVLEKSQSSQKGESYIRNTLALAESHFSTGNCKRALVLYREVLKKYDDKGWTKDAYNYAWCLFHQRQYRKALDVLLVIQNKSRNNKYVDMSLRLKYDLPLFQIMGSEIDDALSGFNQSNTKEILGYLIDKFQEARRTALLHSISGKIISGLLSRKQNELAQIALIRYWAYVDENTGFEEYYSLFVKYQQILQTSLGEKLHASIQRRARIDFNNFIKSKTESKNRAKTQKLINIIQFVLNTAVKQQEDVIILAELEYKRKNYLKSWRLFYDVASDNSAGTNINIVKNAIPSMLATLRFLNNKAHFDVFYKSYDLITNLGNNSGLSNKAQRNILIKLFKMNNDKKNLKLSYKNLVDYKILFPRYKKQGAALLSDLVILTSRYNDIETLSLIDDGVNTNKIHYDSVIKDKIDELNTYYQIEKAQNLIAKGRTDESYELYLDIINNKSSTKDAIINANYNLSYLAYRADNFELFQKHIKNFFSVTDEKNVLSNKSSLVNLSQYSQVYGDLSLTAYINENILRSLCNKKDKIKKLAYQNLMISLIAMEKFSDLLLKMREYKKCRGTETEYNNIIVKLSEVLISRSEYDKTYSLILNHRSIISKFGYPLKESIQYFYKNDLAKYRKLRSIILSLGTKQNDTYLSEAIAFILTNDKFNSSMPILKKPLLFPQDQFDQLLSLKIKTLQDLSNYYLSIESMGSGEAAIGYIMKLIESYDRFIVQLNDFTPQVNDQNYLKSFKDQMKQFILQLSTNKNELSKQIDDLIKKYQFLSKSYLKIQTNKDIEPKYLRPNPILMMRSGGI